MSTARVLVDGVWKQFRRGERHDSLRDLIPALFRRRATARASDEASFWALRDVSFEVHAGEALGIIGRNGAGKSTMLKLLTRILRPTRGSCAVFGRTGALIEIAAGFHPDLTGRENMYLQGAIMGMKRADIAARFDEIIEFSGLENFIDTPVKRYSTGMNARLGFSIAAHLHPDVLLIDEVLSVGDLTFQEKCQARMKRFRDEGAAIVFVTHHLAAVSQLCDRALLLDHGEVARIGSPAAVVREYCSRAGAGTGAPAGDEHEVVIGTRLSAENSEVDDVEREVRPGERLQLDVTLQFRSNVERAVIGVVVWDLRRELYVYGASSDVVGVAPIRARAGDIRTFSFSFEANLTRGLYAIEVNVIDPERHAFIGVARGIAHFQVVEAITYDGVANLYLRGREGAAVQRLREGRPAAAL